MLTGGKVVCTETEKERRQIMSQLLEEILSRDNMMLAYKKVKANKGASGVDGVRIEDIDQYLRDNWVEI